LVVAEPNIEQHEKFRLVSMNEAIDTADVVAVLVKHRQFRDSDFMHALAQKKVLDFCGLGLSQ